MTFNSEYLCSFEQTPKDKKIRELAKAYHDKTEKHDSQICTVKGRDGYIPVTQFQIVSCERNARNVLKDIKAEAERYGISSKELQKAISRYKT
jgi:DNA-binding winged helix-turn-helix (wHTH) protein